jgi:hypothetical protein
MSPTPEYLRHAAEQMVDALWRAMQQAVSEGTAPAFMDPQPPRPLPRLISARDMLVAAGVPAERENIIRFSKRLKRFRDRNFSCCVEMPSDEGGPVSYMYYLHLTAHVAEEFATDFRRAENGNSDR